jgi:hypothetical protein
MFNLKLTRKESTLWEGLLSLCIKRIQRSKISVIPAKILLNSSLIWEFRMLTTVKEQLWVRQALNRNRRTLWPPFKAQIIPRIKTLLKISISKVQALNKSSFSVYIAAEISLKASKSSFNKSKTIKMWIQIRWMMLT